MTRRKHQYTEINQPSGTGKGLKPVTVPPASPRRHKTSGSQTKDSFPLTATESNQSMHLRTRPCSPISRRPREGDRGYQHTQWVALQETNPKERKAGFVILGSLVFSWRSVVSLTDRTLNNSVPGPGGRHSPPAKAAHCGNVLGRNVEETVSHCLPAGRARMQETHGNWLQHPQTIS